LLVVGTSSSAMRFKFTFAGFAAVLLTMTGIVVGPCADAYSCPVPGALSIRVPMWDEPLRLRYVAW